MSWLDDIWGFGEKAFSGTTAGSRMQRGELAKQGQSFRQDLQMFGQIEDPAKKAEAAKMLMNKYPQLLQMQDRMSATAFQGPQEQRFNTAYDKATPQEQKQVALGLRPERPERNPIDPVVRAAENVAKIQQAKGWFSAKELKGNSDLANFFSEATNYATSTVRDLGQKIRGGVNDVAGLFGGAQDKNTKQKPPKLGSPQQIAEDYDPANVSARTDLTQKDYRSYFSLADEGTKVAKDKSGAADEQSGKKKGLADYFQASTDAVPIDNTPQSFSEMGIEDADEQEQFSKLEEAAGKGEVPIDLRKVYQQNPQDFSKLLKALRAGKIDIKEAIELIRESVQ